MSRLSSDLRTLSREAYLYLYPLVTMDITHQQAVALPAGVKPGFGPPNQFHHLREFPPADFRAVVRPNFDTLYSNAWLDLRAGPVRLSVAGTGDRYFLLPMLDMWTDVFAVPGTRTTGTGAQEYVIVGPGYGGTLPGDAVPIHAPTPIVWIIGRTQTNGPADYPAVHAIQDGYRLVEVDPADHAPDPSVDTDTEALTLTNRLDAAAFFTRAAEALKTSPPHSTDFSILARIGALGIVPGVSFDPDRFTASELEEVEAGRQEALDQMRAAQPTLGTSANGWTSILNTIGVYGNAYLQRAVVTRIGLGANPAEEAVYPLLNTDGDGEPMSGDSNYVIHFDARELPPVDAFWSITMYDADGFHAPNPLDRFALGDRDPLVYNPDGSLDIYIQHEDPGPDLHANWLPSPTGPTGITLRLYAPQPAVLSGAWTPPPVTKR